MSNSTINTNSLSGENSLSEGNSLSETNSLQIAVLMGGNSSEAEVSRVSAAQVAQALNNMGHTTTLIEADKSCLGELISMQPDVVFPALHGPPGEDGTIQGCLEILDLPYVGSDVRGSALAMDKAVAKQLFRAAGLPISEELVVMPSEDPAQIVAKISSKLGDSVVIKPLNQGSALGVRLLPNGGDLTEPLSDALTTGPVMVEPYILGREITVGVLETETGLQPHPVIEITTAAGEWYDFTNRYAPGKSEHIIPARLPAATLAELQDVAIRAHRVLGLRDLSRADFLVTDDNRITLLEVNSLPGMTPTSLYPDGARHLGYEFDQLIDYLVRRAYARRSNEAVR